LYSFDGIMSNAFSMHDVSLISASAGRRQQCANFRGAKANLSRRRSRGSGAHPDDLGALARRSLFQGVYFVATPTSASVIEALPRIAENLAATVPEVTGPKNKRH
jgi:hypothetical protein